MTDLPRTGGLALPCSSDPEKWFDRDHQAEAKRVCRTQCPQRIQAACLQLALAAEGRAVSTFRHGVFGGLGPQDRWRVAVGKPRKTGRRRTPSRPPGPAVAPEEPPAPPQGGIDTCSVPGCVNPRRYDRSGLCAGHQTRRWRYGDVRADVPLRPRRRTSREAGDTGEAAA